MFDKALLFPPEVIVIAFYSSNDPLETFQQANGNKRYAFLKLDQSLKSSDMSKVVFPAPESEWWKVQFNDKVSTIFTPRLRHSSNQQASRCTGGLMQAWRRQGAEWDKWP